MPRPDTYSRTQIILHWLIVLAVLFQYVAHEQISSVWRARMAGTVPDVPSFSFHAAVGLLIFILMIWRIWLRFSHGAPALPESDPRWSRILAQSVQGLLYLALVLLPLSGSAAWVLGFDGAIVAHGVLKNLVLLLVALHIAGVLAQQFWFKSDALMKMLGRG